MSGSAWIVNYDWGFRESPPGSACSVADDSQEDMGCGVPYGESLPGLEKPPSRIENSPWAPEKSPLGRGNSASAVDPTSDGLKRAPDDLENSPEEARENPLPPNALLLRVQVLDDRPVWVDYLDFFQPLISKVS